MTRLVVMVVVLALTVTGALLWSDYITNESAMLEDIAKDTVTSIEQEDFKKAEELLNKISDIWTEKERLWSMAIDHSVLHNIEVHCLRAKEYVRRKEKSHALAELQSMRLCIEEIRKSNEFSLMNVL